MLIRIRQTAGQCRVFIVRMQSLYYQISVMLFAVLQTCFSICSGYGEDSAPENKKPYHTYMAQLIHSGSKVASYFL